MGFFTSNAKKAVRESYNSDLTNLDPPDLPNNAEKDVLSVISRRDRIQQGHSRSGSHSQHKSTHQNAFHNITSSGLKGEQERNVVLEQQLKILTHQATTAIDQLNELSQENEFLKRQNQELIANKRTSSASSRASSNKRYVHNDARETSISSTNSSQLLSLFSGANEGTIISKGSSMSSISSYTQGLKQADVDASMEQIRHSHVSQIKEIKSAFGSRIDRLQNEIESLQKEVQSNGSLIIGYQQKIRSLTYELEKVGSENSSLFQRLINSNKKQKLEIEYYRSQLNETLKQLEETRERDHELRKRVMEYDTLSVRMRGSAVH
jgi:chromosome segregation ATPase